MNENDRPQDSDKQEEEEDMSPWVMVESESIENKEEEEEMLEECITERHGSHCIIQITSENVE